MSDFNFHIRFGVHKDRDVIKSLRDSISGMVIPAHILCHSANATIAAILYIKRDYFIDPMTYIYANGSMHKYLTTKDDGNIFKPSIAKLTTSYGLMDFFTKVGFRPLVPKDLLEDEDLAREFCKKNIELQINKVNDEKAGAIKKYADRLKQVGEIHLSEEIENSQKPKFIIPPYFYFESLEDEWFQVNLKLAKITKELSAELPVVPIIFTKADILEEEILKQYEGYEKLLVWLDDLEQKQIISERQKAELESFANFVSKAKEKRIEITNLYGSYFSVLLGKLGLTGMCNGIFYGECKSRKAKVGGIPPSRYYIRKLHEFYSIPETLALLRKYPDLLDKDCDQCMSLIDGNIENIGSFELDHALAQAHFIYSREKEIDDSENKSLEELIRELEEIANQYGDRIPDVNITKKNLQYLLVWKEILEKYR